MFRSNRDNPKTYLDLPLCKAGRTFEIYRLDLMQNRDNCKHFQRDYGAILMNRVGRKGYKIHIQVVGLLWDFRLLKHFLSSN